MFLDTVEILVRSGKGGNGMVHFHREKYKPKGGPDGGDGGKGGDVILVVDPTINTLAKFHSNQKFFADDGKAGGPNNRSGKSALNLEIPIPPGTIVINMETNDILGDLTGIDQSLLVAKGGRGGRGNQHFATSRRQVPLTAEKGEPGEIKKLRLELKLIADVGIVGVPNAGKSSLLAAVSNAKPKISDYPFTTLEPNLGVVNLDLDQSMILADIPGLIEGAHKGVGLGFEFLRHIQRTRVIIHVLDGLSEDPISDFSQINSEMALFDRNLENKPQLVVFNKMDIIDVKDKFLEISQSLKHKGFEILPISTVSRLNLDQMLWKTFEMLSKAPVQEPLKILPVYAAEDDPKYFEISRTNDGWRVTGKAIERAAAMTYWEHPGSLRRFQRLMENLGLDESLREAGIQAGDDVLIGDFILEWQD